MSDLEQNAQKELHGAAYVQQFNSEKQDQRVRQLLTQVSLPSDASILDIGCGTGILSRLLLGHYARYSGIDFSDDMIDAARSLTSNMDNCEFHCADAISFLAGRTNLYDAVFLLDISEHIADQQWAAIIESVHPSLKADGKVYLHTPNREFFVELLKQHGWMRQFPEHIAVRSPVGNRIFFDEAGYSHVEIRSLPHYNVLRWLHPLSRLPILGRHLSARIWLVASK